MTTGRDVSGNGSTGQGASSRGPVRLLKRIGFRRHLPVRVALAAMRTSLAFLLYYSGALAYWRRRRGPRDRPVILMYHSVGGEGLSPEVVVSRERFRSQVRSLSRHCTVISLEEAVAGMERGQTFAPGTVVVTLDDGYRDNLDAWAVLREGGCPATVFVTVEPVESGHLLWAIALLRSLDAARAPELHVSWRGTRGEEIDRVLSLRSKAARDLTRTELLKFAGGLDFAERLAFVASIGEAVGRRDGPDAGSAMLTWDHLRDMRRSGIDIGGHTLTHPRLPGLPPETVQEEIAESRRILSERLGMHIRFFAYPFGWFDEDTKRAVAAAGYTAALSATVEEGHPPVDLMAVERLFVPNEPLWGFAVRLLRQQVHSRLLAWIVRHP